MTSLDLASSILYVLIFVHFRNYVHDDPCQAGALLCADIKTDIEQYLCLTLGIKRAMLLIF